MKEFNLSDHKITIDEGDWNIHDWDDIRSLMRSKKAFNLKINGELFEIRYDRATANYYGWLSDANFVEISDLLPKRLLIGV